MIAADVALDARATRGEGPVWDDQAKELVWLDIDPGEIHRFDPLSGRDRADRVGQPVGAAGLRQAGGLVLALCDGFAVRADGALQWLAATEADRPENRMNDGKPDPRGSFWAGTMALDLRRGAGSLYRLDPDGSVHTVLTGLGISNGIDWTSDRSRMYFVDSLAGGIDVFAYDEATGEISDRRRFTDVREDLGYPDGLTVDAEDHVWLAIWGAAQVRRYAPDGRHVATVELPVTHVTSCAFGGAALDELYITSARAELSRERLLREPHAGGLFVCLPGVRGRAPHRFRG